MFGNGAAGNHHVDELFDVAVVFGPKHNDREVLDLLGLHERDGFEKFVHGAHAARHDNKAEGVLHEHDLADKEVLELDHEVEPRITALLVRQTDVAANGIAPCLLGAPVCSFHDAWTSTGHDGEAHFGETASHFAGLLVVDVVLGEAGGAEDADGWTHKVELAKAPYKLPHNTTYKPEFAQSAMRSNKEFALGVVTNGDVFAWLLRSGWIHVYEYRSMWWIDLQMSETVHAMFSSIAPNYDRTNTVLSLGVHHLWRRAVVRASQARRGTSVLDCATGTGDLALAFKRTVGNEGRAVGTDFNADMLEVARGKGHEKGLDIEWSVADAMQLPFADATFDVVTIAFGIRNVDDPVRALSEMARVCKPNGRVIVLEFGQPRGPLGFLYRFYSRFVMPVIGGLLTGNKKAYEYLPSTAAAFPAGENFLTLMRATQRFASVAAQPLTGGIAFIYTGVSS